MSSENDFSFGRVDRSKGDSKIPTMRLNNEK
jgi:hypothetical protein